MKYTIRLIKNRIHNLESMNAQHESCIKNNICKDYYISNLILVKEELDELKKELEQVKICGKEKK